MKVVCEIEDYANNELRSNTVKIRSTAFDGDMVEIEFNNVKCKVLTKDLISAVQRATLDCFGK